MDKKRMVVDVLLKFRVCMHEWRSKRGIIHRVNGVVSIKQTRKAYTFACHTCLEARLLLCFRC